MNTKNDEIIHLLRDNQEKLASAFSLLVLEITEIRALVQTILGTQGGILTSLGHPEEKVRTDLQQALEQIVDQELTRVRERLGGLAQMLNHRQSESPPE